MVWGRGDGEFKNPSGIAVDTAGNIYVADQGNHRIQKFDGEGNFLTKWGTWGFEIGEFWNPSGVAIDAADNVYVADQTNGRIQVFEPRVSGPVSFTANTTAGPAPLTVRFTGQSTGNPPSWHWDFGDGSTSTEQNPVHTYTSPSNYTVSLSGEGGICIKSGYIKVTPVLFGDADGDGRVNQADTLLVLQQVVGAVKPEMIPDPGTEEFWKIDVNQNGVIDVGDALFIAQYSVGQDVWFEVF